MSRPEHVAPPEVFYDEQEAVKYLTSSRMINVQTTLAERCLELLALESSHALLLDVGCGSGLSGDVLVENGHLWVGFDVSRAMLDAAVARDVEGDLVLLDVGAGLPLRAACFDGAISVSAIQWLCNVDKAGDDVRQRLHRFFESLYGSLRRGARAVLQFYPENVQQLELISAAAMRAGFHGGVVVDFPNSTRAKKYYLCVSAGASSATTPKAMGAEGEARRQRPRPRRSSASSGPHEERQWIIQKKERQRRQGKEVRADSKYTGRRRSKRF